MSKDGGPAFPSVPDGRGMTYANGMRLRDYFAAAALPIVAPLASPAHSTVHWCVRTEAFDELAGYAYALADAMLKARDLQREVM